MRTFGRIGDRLANPARVEYDCRDDYTRPMSVLLAEAPACPCCDGRGCLQVRSLYDYLTPEWEPCDACYGHGKVWPGAKPRVL